MSASTEFLEQLSSAARAMQNETDHQGTLDRAVAAATSIIGSCDHAGICIVHKGTVITRAASDETALAMHELQHRMGEGPAVDALREQDTVCSPDVGLDERWPRWGPRVAAELGVRSVLSYRLFTTKDTLGAFNLLSRERDAFDEQTVSNALALAAHVALAVAAELNDAHLHIGLTTRTVIGQAQGILMERFDLSAERAFEVLVRLSSQQKLKLHDVASELVTSRQLPRPDVSQRSRRAPAGP